MFALQILECKNGCLLRSVNATQFTDILCRDYCVSFDKHLCCYLSQSNTMSFTTMIVFFVK